MDQKSLAAFLRSRRERTAPRDAGIEPGPRRRTPGLRREEVAALAGISVDYYVRLEQARGPRPSRQVLTALARALRLSDAERTHLFRLAGDAPEPPRRAPQRVPQGVLRLLDRLDDTPAFVHDAKYDLLAYNTMADLLLGLSRLPAERRNVCRSMFQTPGVRLADLTPAQRDFARVCVNDLRGALARYPHDPGVTRLIAELRTNPDFTDLWDEHGVEVPRTYAKTIRHPVVGEIDLHCDTLEVPDLDQRVVLYTAAPGTPAHEALALLRVVGPQNLSPDGERQPR
ncbi:helix-turn-helix transcriptional regulator [Actinocorallia sp. API 0066]|uniref:helix-turn-helix transcriptional regulator n=1 Tax=Actinocorallia sp. API 0066 TaxID=2896846 RepID=UPI001E4D7EF0|nr:helix-turn-helix transcriptional regulator [Actinocorallia sp. API 0066]MCD0452596.1 helix-turn-helix transcriptional regulator [Actinocorallia sp. API 0066]